MRPDQWDIATHPAKFKFLSMGRRWGKTIMGGDIAVSTAAVGGRVAWVVPTYKNGRPLWRWVENVLAQTSRRAVQVNRSERIVEFPNGGGLGIFTAAEPDSIRGEAFHLVILDEAARISEEAYYDAIQPTLADFNGDLIAISTPKGRNWFWREWEAARQDGTTRMAWRAPSSANPNENIRRAFALARERVVERTFQQEWLADFVEAEGLVFRRIYEAATAYVQLVPVEGHKYACGIDWGRHYDSTVFVVIDLNTKEVVYVDRMTKIDFALQTGRLRSLHALFNFTVIVPESNSFGEPLVEDLTREGLPIRAFQTSNATKEEAVLSLALAFEQGKIRIPPEDTIIEKHAIGRILIDELLSYEQTRLPSGLFRYSAPEGVHDDCVIALALAWAAASYEPAKPFVIEDW